MEYIPRYDHCNLVPDRHLGIEGIELWLNQIKPSIKCADLSIYDFFQSLENGNKIINSLLK